METRRICVAEVAQTSVVIRRTSYASNHESGANFALCDGSTHYVNESIEHNQLTYAAFLANPAKLGLYQRLFAKNDGLTIDDY